MKAHVVSTPTLPLGSESIAAYLARTDRRSIVHVYLPTTAVLNNVDETRTVTVVDEENLTSFTTRQVCTQFNGLWYYGGFCLTLAPSQHVSLDTSSQGTHWYEALGAFGSIIAYELE